MWSQSGYFQIFGPPYWIHHFEFSSSEFRFVISDPENPLCYILKPNRVFSNFLSTILDPLFWIFKFGFRIRNQLPQKPPMLHFEARQGIFRFFCFFAFLLRRHIGSAILNFSILTTRTQNLGFHKLNIIFTIKDPNNTNILYFEVKQDLFGFLVHHLGSAILNFSNLPSDS